METRRQVGATLILCLLCAGSGCSTPAGRYCAHRGQDLADCFELTAGAGGPAYANLRATDLVVLAGGLAGACRWGWRGRYAQALAGPTTVDLEFGVPFCLNVQAIFDPQKVKKAERESDNAVEFVTDHSLRHVCTILTWWTEHAYHEEARQPGPRGRTAEALWIGATATFVLSTRIGFNPAELADFVTGCLGWDLLRDDGWPPRDEGGAT